MPMSWGRTTQQGLHPGWVGHEDSLCPRTQLCWCVQLSDLKKKPHTLFSVSQTKAHFWMHCAELILMV